MYCWGLPRLKPDTDSPDHCSEYGDRIRCHTLPGFAGRQSLTHRRDPRGMRCGCWPRLTSYIDNINALARRVGDEIRSLRESAHGET